MTIRSFMPAQLQERQPTQATPYYDALMQRFEQQSKENVPRSRQAWGAEQQRLGSWGSGLGALRPVGTGSSYRSGVGRPLFSLDEEDQ